MKKYTKGFTAGVFDVFHIGHLNLLEAAKTHCEHLIVGVNSDDLVEQYKNKRPIESVEDRMHVVGAIRYVDEVVEIHSLDKIEALNKYGFDVVFIGDDWKGSDRWMQTEADLKKLGVDVVYIPYTKGISSTRIRDEKGLGSK